MERRNVPRQHNWLARTVAVIAAAAAITVTLLGNHSAPDVPSASTDVAHHLGGLADGDQLRTRPPRRPAAQPTTTTTTMPLAPLDWTYEVATAAADVPHVDVYNTQPEGAVQDERIVTRFAEWEAQNLPPRSPTAPGLSELPGQGRNIVGRIGTENGWALLNPNSFGEAPVFWVMENHGDWLRVQVPARPNGASGWVHSSQVAVHTRSVRVVVSVTQARLWVLDGDTTLLDTPVVVGAAGSPTPTGRLYVTHHEYTGRPHGGYGPWILGLSGYSETLETFSGGAPGLALHGTNRPELAGQHRSNGCIRVPNDALEELRHHAPPGTVVDIVE